MFDLSLVELGVVALVALLVLGPEKLPRAARTAGLYLRRARQSWYSVKADIERELAADELKRSLERQQREAEAAGKTLGRELEGKPAGAGETTGPDRPGESDGSAAPPPASTDGGDRDERP